jgi:ABC-type sugar transport system ATPase subunit
VSTTLAPIVRTGTPVLTIRGLSKTFLGQRALRDVDLEVYPGEVHALLGENGSGKSTLIKCLAGYHEPDPGAHIAIGGREVPLPYQPTDAARLGLAFVHQDLGLVPNLTVAENFALSRRYDARLLGRIGWPAVEARAEAELATLGHAIDPRTPVGRLPIAEQTLVAIARALAEAEENARVLVLDEPTAALPDARRRVNEGSRNEVDLLFEAVRQVLGRGVGVIYVSHKLHEIVDLAHRATVLRDGRRVDSLSLDDVSESELVKAIVGRDVRRAGAVTPARVTVSSTRPVLEVSDLSGPKLSGLSFTVRPGEIVGLAGMLGSGRSELARILFGAQRRTGGTIHIDGVAVDLRGPREAVRQGIALIPQDRRRDGAVLGLSVAHNLTLPSLKAFFRRGRLQRRQLDRHANELVASYDIRPRDIAKQFRLLSGGNQQKVVIAKWLSRAPRLVIFDEPVQGVDVGARAEIFEVVRRTAEQGAGVVLASSELEPMLELCTRILVLHDGRLTADLPANGLDRHELTTYVYFGTAGAGVPRSREHPRSEDES